MNITELKMKDLAEVEKLSGYNMDEWETCPKVQLTMAIAYVSGKKSNPDLTWEQVENMSIQEMNLLAGEEALPKATIS
jgi:hypothetical protein